MRSRTAETVAMLMIGDGVLATLAPEEHVRLWRTRPRGFGGLLAPFERSPALTRIVGLTEIAAGLWLANLQFRRRRGFLRKFFG